MISPHYMDRPLTMYPAQHLQWGYIMLINNDFDVLSLASTGTIYMVEMCVMGDDGG
jgi:hypothetical protein